MVAQALIQAVEKAVAAGAEQVESSSNTTNTDSLISMPPTTDLFVLQRLFMVDKGNNKRSNTATPTTGAGTGASAGGIERALAVRQAVQPDVYVAWGNTNTKPTDYKAALLLAAQQRRPVHFVVYHAAHSTNVGVGGGDVGAAFEDVCWDLAVPHWHELLERSVRRLLQTGRYVPASVIWDMHGRTRQMMQRVVADQHQYRPQQRADMGVDDSRKSSDTNSAVDSNTTSSRRIGKLELDRGLARLCGFDMNEQRLVSEGYRVPAAIRSRRDSYSNGSNIRGGSSHRQ
jgi:hypothetical protein